MSVPIIHHASNYPSTGDPLPTLMKPGIKKVSASFALSSEAVHAMALPDLDWADMMARAAERRERDRIRGKRTLVHEEPLTPEQEDAIQRARALLKALEEEYARPDTLLEHDYDEGYYLPEDIHGKRTYRYENGEEETV